MLNFKLFNHDNYEKTNVIKRVFNVHIELLRI